MGERDQGQAPQLDVQAESALQQALSLRCSRMLQRQGRCEAAAAAAGQGTPGQGEQQQGRREQQQRPPPGNPGLLQPKPLLQHKAQFRQGLIRQHQQAEAQPEQQQHDHRPRSPGRRGFRAV
jgi:hypothetical protein